MKDFLTLEVTRDSSSRFAFKAQAEDTFHYINRVNYFLSSEQISLLEQFRELVSVGDTVTINIRRGGKK